MHYRITAWTTWTDEAGWSHQRDLLGFELNAEVLGLVDRAQAQRVAHVLLTEVLVGTTPPKDFTVHTHAEEAPSCTT